MTASTRSVWPSAIAAWWVILASWPPPIMVTLGVAHSVHGVMCVHGPDLHGCAYVARVSVHSLVVSFTDATIARLPRPIRPYVERHHELIKFAIVGATTFVIDSAVFYTLKLTMLEPKPVTAKIIAGIVAVIASYILNREWSFQDRGGRERHHEALLFFGVSGVGVLLSMAPLWFSSYVLHAARARGLADDREHRRLRLRLHHRQPAADGVPVLGVPALGVPRRVRPRPGQGPRVDAHRGGIAEAMEDVHEASRPVIGHRARLIQRHPDRNARRQRLPGDRLSDSSPPSVSKTS